MLMCDSAELRTITATCGTDITASVCQHLNIPTLSTVSLSTLVTPKHSSASAMTIRSKCGDHVVGTESCIQPYWQRRSSRFVHRCCKLNAVCLLIYDCHELNWSTCQLQKKNSRSVISPYPTAYNHNDHEPLASIWFVHDPLTMKHWCSWSVLER